MPEPACADVGVGAMTTTTIRDRRSPRPRPRLSLVSTNALNIPTPMYENITNGWSCDDSDHHHHHRHQEIGSKSQHRKDDDADKVGDVVMAASSYQPKSSHSVSTSCTRTAAGIPRRATLSLMPTSSFLHSNIPVPQTNQKNHAVTAPASAAAKSVPRSSIYSACGSESKLKFVTPPPPPLPHSSPRLVKEKAAPCQMNGHSKIASSATTTTTTTCKTVSSSSEKHVEVTQTCKKVTQFKRVTLKNSSMSTSVRGVDNVTRSMETLSTVVAATSDGDVGKEVTSAARKSEYRKSVSIPPHLVAHLTSKFNALSERCQPPLILSPTSNGSDIKIAPQLQTLPVPNGNGVSCTAKAKGDVQFGARVRSTARPSPPTQQDINSSSSSSSSLEGNHTNVVSRSNWIQRPKPITRKVFEDGPSQVVECSNRVLIDAAAAVVAAAALPKIEDDESRLTSVKQAIHNYEVAFLKSSTSSPELQRRLSFAKCNDGRPPLDSGSTTNQRSRTLPATTADTRTLSADCMTGVATLPNIPCRSPASFDGRPLSLLPRAVGRLAPARGGNQTTQATKTAIKEIKTSTSSAPSMLRCATKTNDHACNKSELFRAKPVMVVQEEPTKASLSKSDDAVGPVLPAPNSGVGARRGRRSFRPSVDEESLDSHRSSLSLGPTEMGSMDLLAEIESHPSLVRMSIAANSNNLSKKRSMSSTSSSSSSSVAPNVSFLWKESTQTFVQSKVAAYGSNSSVDSSSEVKCTRLKASDNGPPTCDKEEEEPLYEELFNFVSHTQLNGLKRPSMELPAVIAVEDFSTSSDDSSVGEGMMTYYLKSQSVDTALEEEEEDDRKGDGNESWTDYSESEDDGQSKTSNSSCKSKLRPGAGKRRRNGRNLMRRSWSQSLRDLANVHRNEGMSQQECVSDLVAAAGWEEVTSSDGSTENAATDADLNKDDEVTADTELDDKSLASVVREEVYEIQETRKANSKERKVKKVKRNWTWSKAEFKLDFSSKFEKIRLTSRKPHRTTEHAATNVELSPSKKSRQWNLKAKFAQMKSGSGSTDGKGEQQRSPNSCTQFYVPTYEDGTLAATPSGSSSNEDSPKSEKAESVLAVVSENAEPGSIVSEKADSRCVSVEVIPSHEISSSREGSSRRLRRVSSGAAGMVARPKTAPPAPPNVITKCGSSPSPVQTLSDNTASSDFGYGSQTWSSGSLNHEPVHRLNSEPAQRTRSLKSDATSVAMATCNLRQRTSVTSESSSETCTESEDRFLVNGEIVRDFVKVLPTLLLDRENRISQLELPAVFPPDISRLSCKLSPFNDEPLYQFYNAAARLRAAHENQVDDDDGRNSESADPYYESIYQMQHGTDCELEGEVDVKNGDDDDDDGEESSLVRKTTAMELVRTTAGGVRTLWCEVPEVRSSGVLDALSMQKRRLQEAMFEVITSEASYLKSLNVLVDCFVHCPLLSDDYSVNCVLSRREGHVLFSDVMPVRETSERLLADLERRWQESIVIADICDILLDHATKHFEVYVKYCSNQLYQDRCLKKLKETNAAFVEVVRKLEMSPTCQQLSMHSFLMLPMQRITRLPLLVDAIFQRLDFGTKQYDTCKQALATLNKIVHECNEGAHRMERMEEMLIISRHLDFRDCRCLALISASRWLVKRGELTRLVFGDSSSKLSFGRRCAKQSVYLFLFTDLLIVAKKKSDDCYNVLDYCPRNLVQATEIESPEQLPGRTHDGCRNIFQLSMLQNHDNKTVEMFFSCPKESDLTRWVEAVTPKKSENPDERIYEEWDCPQVQVIHQYSAQQPDELSLEESDVVNVFRKMADGWYQGERIRDGVQGWFPSNFTVEIVSSHIRARNLRQRYRLLALSHSYVENQRKKELSKTK